MVAYNNKKYYIDIIETKPDTAISIIETDCEVDFAPPLDYKEPEKPTAPLSAGKAAVAAEVIPAEDEPKFNPFSGTGRRLDGKPLNYQPPPVSSSGSKDQKSDVVNSLSSTASSSQSNARQSQGKLVFGSNANRTNETGKAKESKPEPPKEKEEPKFQPFSGKKYSLRG